MILFFMARFSLYIAKKGLKTLSKLRNDIVTLVQCVIVALAGASNFLAKVIVNVR